MLDRRFGVEYQPIVDLASGATVAHEALSRFYGGPDRAYPPAPLFARLHDEPSMLLHVELETKRFQIERAPAGPLFVNVDPDSYHAGAGGPGHALLDTLGRCTVPLVVESIEILGARDGGRSSDMIRALRARGLGVALDDIGAPGALLSLDALAEVDVLKLDRSWLRRARDPRQRAVLDALAGLARRLGARTVLEGVETAEHLAFARELGVDAVQGFLFRDRFVSSLAA